MVSEFRSLELCFITGWVALRTIKTIVGLVFFLIRGWKMHEDSLVTSMGKICEVSLCALVPVNP